MKNVPVSQGKQPSDAVRTREGETQRGVHDPRPFEIILWIAGLVVVSILGVTVHAHPTPWPFELDLTKAIQGPHPIPCVYSQLPSSTINNVIDFISSMNNALPSIIALVVWDVILLIARLWRQAIFLSLAVGAGTGLFTVVGNLVGRPRPDVKYGICVHDLIPFHSFPSGHVIHDVVFYGFLLYISVSPPVSTWRYRWILLPLQILAALDITLIGFARLFAGEHWLTDVLGAYIIGALCLFFFIFAYRWLIKRLVKKS